MSTLFAGLIHSAHCWKWAIPTTVRASLPPTWSFSVAFPWALQWSQKPCYPKCGPWTSKQHCYHPWACQKRRILDSSESKSAFLIRSASESKAAWSWRLTYLKYLMNPSKSYDLATSIAKFPTSSYLTFKPPWASPAPARAHSLCAPARPKCRLRLCGRLSGCRGRAFLVPSALAFHCSSAPAHRPCPQPRWDALALHAHPHLQLCVKLYLSPEKQGRDRVCPCSHRIPTDQGNVQHKVLHKISLYLKDNGRLPNRTTIQPSNLPLIPPNWNLKENVRNPFEQHSLPIDFWEASRVGVTDSWWQYKHSCVLTSTK